MPTNQRTNNTHLFFVYILKCFYHRNTRDNEVSYYKGYTKNLKRRYLEHKSGRSGYTKRFKGNVEMVYVEEVEDRVKQIAHKRARYRETKLKRTSKQRIINLIELKKRRSQQIFAKYLT